MDQQRRFGTARDNAASQQSPTSEAMLDWSSSLSQDVAPILTATEQTAAIDQQPIFESQHPMGPTDTGPRNYVRPDELILDEIARTITYDPMILASDLDIECSQGNVRISGTVPLMAAKRHLEVIVAAVFGVRELSITDVEVNKGILPPSHTAHGATATDTAAILQGTQEDDDVELDQP